MNPTVSVAAKITGRSSTPNLPITAEHLPITTTPPLSTALVTQTQLVLRYNVELVLRQTHVARTQTTTLHDLPRSSIQSSFCFWVRGFRPRGVELSSGVGVYLSTETFCVISWHGNLCEYGYCPLPSGTRCGCLNEAFSWRGSFVWTTTTWLGSWLQYIFTACTSLGTYTRLVSLDQPNYSPGYLNLATYVSPPWYIVCVSQVPPPPPSYSHCCENRNKPQRPRNLEQQPLPWQMRWPVKITTLTHTPILVSSWVADYQWTREPSQRKLGLHITWLYVQIKTIL